MTLVEGIIDDTRATLPAMMERYPDETLTYRMEKICEKDLLRQLKEYFDMSVESRQNYSQDMIQRLDRYPPPHRPGPKRSSSTTR
jgi:hypothetical protein